MGAGTALADEISSISYNHRKLRGQELEVGYKPSQPAYVTSTLEALPTKHSKAFQVVPLTKDHMLKSMNFQRT